MQQLKRMGVGSSGEEDQGHSDNLKLYFYEGEEENLSFIDLQHNSLKLPEKKGILKKHDYGILMMGDGKENWVSSGANDEIISQVDMSQLVSGPGPTEVERTLKTLNGYHEDIIKALRNAASSHREEENLSLIDLQHNSLKLPEKKGILKKHDYGILVIGDGKENWVSSGANDEIISQVDMSQLVSGPGSTEVERTLKTLNGYHEDIIKELRNAASSHKGTSTPSGSTSALSEELLRRSLAQCAESYSDYKRSGSKEDVCEQQPSSRLPYPHPHSHHQVEEESIYETADHERGAPCGDTPDSESDEFIQAQQQLARWASEDTMGGQPGPSGGSVNVGSAVPREYYPSPSSSTSEEPPSIARAPAPTPGSHVPHPDHATIHRPKRYPEYKH
ncbi:unnamed protein product [Diabrotica balteata]|uniref:Uncharacterized protein n=1 Tax=Diabrotica balteata TaxID=107213 RepID=A0A9N9X4D2_DIABA|nr:unnamed protein product [Diabrotica balteata]